MGSSGTQLKQNVGMIDKNLLARLTVNEFLIAVSAIKRTKK